MPGDNGNAAVAEVENTIDLDAELDKAFEAARDKMHDGGADSFMNTAQKLGVLQTLIHAVADDKEYRQVLLLAAFDDKREALLYASAIAECRRYGATIEPLVDRIIAQCSVKGGRVDKVLEAMTHQWIGTNNASFTKKQQQKKESLT